MAVDIRAKLEQTMKQAQQSINLEPIQQQLADIRAATVLNKSSVLGNFANEVKGGFEALNSVIDDVQSNIPASILDQQTAGVVIGRLTESIPEVKDKLIQAIDSPVASDIQALTGTAASAASSLLDVVITSPTPQAIADNLKTVAEATVPQLENITKNLVNLDIPLNIEDFGLEHIGGVAELNASLLTQTIGNVTGLSNNLLSQVGNVTSNLTQQMSGALQAMSGAGFGSLVENSVESFTGNALSTVSKLAVKNNIPMNISSSDLKEIIQFTQSGDINRAVAYVQKFSDAEFDVIAASLKSIDNSAFTNVAKAAVTRSPLVATDLRSIGNSWSGISTRRSHFTVVNSKEELETDILSATREITEVVTHWTETGINENLSAFDIHQELTRLYNIAIPYHYVITRDGNIQRGRPINQALESSTTLPNSHHLRSIHIAFVGGINRPVGKETAAKDVLGFKSKQSFTLNQWKAYKRFVQAAKRAYPGMEFLGHNDIDPTMLDPGFDVRSYIKSTFGFDSFLIDPQRQPPATREQIATLAQPDTTSDLGE